MTNNTVTQYCLVPNPQFQHGRVVCTPGVLVELELEEILLSLARHLTGDWGSLCKEDREYNYVAVENGGRIFSQYETATGRTFWIITEADRSVTTVLLPEEY